jgi:hypothetical protein
MSEPTEKESEDLPVHVHVCRERYHGINARLKRLELAVWFLIVVLIGNGNGAVTNLMFRALGLR